MNMHQKALDQMFGDMDDMESQKMFGGDKKADAGVDITISIAPKGAGEPDSDEDTPDEMCEGGKAGYADGGVVEAPEPDEMALPPFLRKKKIG